MCMLMCVCSVCVCVCTYEDQNLESQVCVHSLLPDKNHKCFEPNSGLLEKQQILFNIEPFLQPWFLDFWKVAPLSRLLICGSVCRIFRNNR